MAKQFTFPSDLGKNTFERRTKGTDDTQPFFFVNFGIVTLANSNKAAGSGNSNLILDREGNQRNIEDINLADNYLFSDLLDQGTYNKKTETNIFLYMPDDIKVNYSTDLTTMDRGFLKTYLDEGMVAGALNSLDAIGGTTDKLKQLATAIGLGFTAADSSKNILDMEKAKTGTSFNPVTEQMFKNVKLRNFDYKFDLVPRNAAEGEIVQSIIKEFKFHMHPNIINKVEFQNPSLFVIAYYKFDPAKNMGIRMEKLHKISACYLEDMNVDYSGTGNQFSTFNDGQPVHIKLDLKFRETVIQTKDSINEGF